MSGGHKKIWRQPVKDVRISRATGIETRSQDKKSTENSRGVKKKKTPFISLYTCIKYKCISLYASASITPTKKKEEPRPSGRLDLSWARVCRFDGNHKNQRLW